MGGMDLEVLREELDKIDDLMLDLVSRRFEITREIGVFKKENVMEVFQPEREMVVLKKKWELGERLGLEAKFVGELFEVIFKESKRRQKVLVDMGKDEDRDEEE